MMEMMDRQMDRQPDSSRLLDSYGYLSDEAAHEVVRSALYYAGTVV